MKNKIIGNMGDRAKTILWMLALASVLAFVYIQSAGNAADVTYQMRVPFGQTFNTQAVDVGSTINAPMVFSANHQYYTVTGFHYGATTTRWISVPLDAATTGYQHGGTAYLIVRDLDIGSYLAVGSTVSGLYGASRASWRPLSGATWSAKSRN